MNLSRSKPAPEDSQGSPESSQQNFERRPNYGGDAKSDSGSGHGYQQKSEGHPMGGANQDGKGQYTVKVPKGSSF